MLDIAGVVLMVELRYLMIGGGRGAGRNDG